MPQLKYTDWQIGLKVKTHQYAVFRRPISCADTHRLKIKRWGNIYQENGKPKNLEVAVLVSDKTDFKPTKIKKDKKKALCSGKEINATRRANYHKYICT